MKRREILAAVVLLSAALAVLLLVFTSKSDSRLAVITLDGETVRTIDLDRAADEEFTISGENGFNVISVKNGQISVTQASCPDKVCVKHGELHSKALPIVCLPNKLVIRLM